jgi:hypothetical protein
LTKKNKSLNNNCPGYGQKIIFMNIYANEGHKVRLSKNLGKGEFPECLQKGKVYTVNYTRVGSFTTRVYLKEFGNQSFNSVIFDDIENQVVDKTLHPDYALYHQYQYKKEEESVVKKTFKVVIKNCLKRLGYMR